MPMVAHTTVEYIIPSVSNNGTATEEQCCLQPVLRCYKQDKSGIAVRELLWFSHCELLLLEAGS
jgi:hypothetical protein